jgi:hypothetical protein
MKALAWVVVGLGISNLAQAGIFDGLTPDQQAAVQNGEQVFVTQDVSGAPWPKVFIYQRLDATPEEAAAVFSDYALQSSYMPKLKKSALSTRSSKTTVDIDYTLSMPWPLSDQNYTTRDTVSEAGGTYSVTWSLVRGDAVKRSDGTISFEALGTGSVMSYYNFVIPSSSFAGALKNQATEQVKAVAGAFLDQVAKERSDDQDQLQQQIQALRDALN